MMRAAENTLASVFGPARAATLRNTVSNLWRWGFALAGRYQPIPDSEMETVLEAMIPFKGDVPRQIEDGSHRQGRMGFRLPRPVSEKASDVVVTPLGGAWVKNCFFERYSAGRPGLRLFFESRRAEETIPEAVIVQSAHCLTYGDWVSEYMGAVLRASPLKAPLLIPEKTAAKPFVARDLDALGVDWRVIAHPIKVKKAVVLRQKKVFVHFPEDEARLLRRIFGEPITPARRGGIVYISRFGEQSDIANRPYPSRLIEEIVEARGGKVIRSIEATRETYEAAAGEAETVIFDHGSAFYNALGWPVLRAVEVMSDTWWNNAFLMLANAAGIKDYTIIRGSLGKAHVRALLEKTLDAPLDVKRVN